MRKLLGVSLLLLLVPTLALAEVWASAKSQVYHYRLCRWTAKIKQEYRISFISAAAARKAGYQPCATCRPPGIEPVPFKKQAGKS